MKYRFFSNHTPEVTRREMENRNLAREIAREGIVLLENNGLLPLKKHEKIALYGAGGRMTIKGGSGSGDVRERFSVNIEDGLKNVGFKMTTTAWLDTFDADYIAKRKAWKDDLDRKMKGSGFNGMWQVLMDNPFLFPVGHRITEKDLSPETETAIYVVARQAGEGADRHIEKGDYLLDDIEYENIRFLTEHSPHTVVVINCGSMMDLRFFDEIGKIDALVFFSQGGEEGGNALADLLCGDASPSGHLTDTWGKRYEDYPSWSTYSDQNGDVQDEYYYEDIYVGYRWFDAKGIKPRYPFGYGLSYTYFSLEMKSLEQTGSCVSLQVEIRNTGEIFAGKDVAQAYIAFPESPVHREQKALCAFAKSGTLQPGEMETLTLSFDLKDFAAFDEENACFRLWAGKYILLLGRSAEEVQPVGTVYLKEDIITENVRHACAPVKEFTKVSISAPGTWNTENCPTVEMDASCFETQQHDYSGNTRYHDPLVDELLSRLSLKDKVEFLCGGSLFGKCYNNTPGAVGRTTSGFVKKKIPNINFGDGPAGLNVFQDMVITRSGNQKFLSGMPESYNYGIMKKLTPFLKGKPSDGHTLYQYCTAWPAPMLCAQTWNCDLMKAQGEGVAREMQEIGISLWLAPGMNIHRNPLCGRHFEYYSEDPFLTGSMAISVTRGLQDRGGVGVTVKHFACNNQENNRNEMSAHLSERALREIYLKGFRMVVEHAKPWAVMSSYNCINGIYNGNNPDLLISILRNEWGFDGLVMTDWNSITPTKGNNVLCPASGNDLIMPGNRKAKAEILRAVHEGKLSQEAVDICVSNVLRLITRTDVYRNDPMMK